MHRLEGEKKIPWKDRKHKINKWKYIKEEKRR